MVKKISQDEFQEVRDSAVAVVDFSATWCNPCKMLAPVLEEISTEMDNVNFFNIDVDDNPDISGEYGIQSIPAIIVFKNGEVADQTVGFQPKENLVKLIQAQL